MYVKMGENIQVYPKLCGIQEIYGSKKLPRHIIIPRYGCISSGIMCIGQETDKSAANNGLSVYKNTQVARKWHVGLEMSSHQMTLLST